MTKKEKEKWFPKEERNSERISNLQAYTDDQGLKHYDISDPSFEKLFELFEVLKKVKDQAKSSEVLRLYSKIESDYEIRIFLDIKRNRDNSLNQSFFLIHNFIDQNGEFQFIPINIEMNVIYTIITANSTELSALLSLFMLVVHYFDISVIENVVIVEQSRISKKRKADWIHTTIDFNENQIDKVVTKYIHDKGLKRYQAFKTIFGKVYEEANLKDVELGFYG